MTSHARSSSGGQSEIQKAAVKASGKPVAIGVASAGTSSERSTARPAAERRCYHCGQPGHIRPLYPLRTPQTGSSNQRPATLGTMRAAMPERITDQLAVAVKVRAPGKPAGVPENEHSYTLLVDTRSEVNLIGDSWLPLLLLDGTKLRKVPPLEIGWVTN